VIRDARPAMQKENHALGQDRIPKALAQQELVTTTSFNVWVPGVATVQVVTLKRKIIRQRALSTFPQSRIKTMHQASRQHFFSPCESSGIRAFLVGALSLA
jgi:hypothetical protein